MHGEPLLHAMSAPLTSPIHVLGTFWLKVSRQLVQLRSHFEDFIPCHLMGLASLHSSVWLQSVVVREHMLHRLSKC